MLDVFKRPGDPIEHPQLYAIPAAVFGGSYLLLAGMGPSPYTQVHSTVCHVLFWPCCKFQRGGRAAVYGSSRTYLVEGEQSACARAWHERFSAEHEGVKKMLYWCAAAL